MKHAFVTGGSGFIGRYLVAELIKQGIEVTALMRATSKIPLAWTNKVKIVIGDIKSLGTLKEEIGEFDTMFHLAAIVSDWGGKQEHVDTTVHGTEQAIELCLQNQARLIVTTSVATFGDKLGTGKLTERTERGTPSSNYEYVKQRQEDITLEAVRNKSLHATIIRPSNVYGIDSVWVNRFVEKLSQRQPALMGDGNWDAGLVHVQHVVDSMILAARSTTLESGEIFVIADDPGVTWQQYLNTLSNTLNLPKAKSIPNWLARGLAPILEGIGKLINQKNPPLVTNLAYRLTGVESVYCNDKAKQLLGYEPSITLEQGMAEIKQHFDSITREN